MGIGDWGLGIGDWGLGPNPKPPTPIPQPPTPQYKIKIISFFFEFDIINLLFEK